MKFLLVAMGFLAGPGVIFLLPYIISANVYANFAKVLTFSQLITLVSGLGLEIAAAKFNVKISKVNLIVLCSTSIFSSLLFMAFSDLNFIEKIIIWSISSVTLLSVIYQSYFLFSGQALLYGLYGVVRSIIMIISLLILLNAKVDVTVAYGGASIISFIFTSWLINKRKKTITSPDAMKISALFMASIPFFIINGVSVLPITLDRLVAQQNLAIIEFSKYVVVTTWAVPILYLGNIFQQFLISRFNIFSIKKLINNIIILLLLNIAYAIFIWFITQFFLKIPYFNSVSDFHKIWFLVSGWYSLYSAFAYPAAAYVQRAMQKNLLNSLAKWTTVSIPVALIISYLAALNFWGNIGMYAAVIFSSFFASITLLPRIFFVQRELKKNVHN